MEHEPYRFRHYAIRPDMMGAIRRYIDHGIPPGSFLTAVIENNLSEAVGRADNENLENLPAFLAYFYNEAPSPCWGSPAKRQAWVAERSQTGPCPDAGGSSVESGGGRDGRTD